IFVTSALFSIVHFLKAPMRTSTIVTWSSGFNSIAHSFSQFANPMLVAAGFTTLFLIGWILADARVRTRSLWLAIGLRAGWTFAFETSVAAYRSRGIVRRVCIDIKYRRHSHLRPPVTHSLLAALDDDRLRGHRFSIIIPVPLHPAPERQRGFNQAGLLSALLS